jgi:uroporphyrinogen-III synthase
VTARAGADSRPLSGWHVLVTRPAGRGDALADTLRALGAHVGMAPLLAIEALPLGNESRHIAQQLDIYDLVIVTSVNAVRAWLPLLADFWPQWPLAQDWIAVGQGTGNALAAYGITARTPAEPSSEGLLALPVLADVRGRRVLLVAGEGGRDAIEQSLRTDGAIVTRLATYRRIRSTAGTDSIAALAASCRADCPEASADIPGGKPRCAVLVTSADALQNLLALAPWLPGSAVLLVVASERIAAQARVAGINDVVVAGGADDASQVTALRRRAGAHPDEDVE